MERYYKIHKDSSTGKQLLKLVAQFKEYSELKKKFIEKYDIESTFVCSFYWIELGEVSFKTIPKNLRDNWKKGSVKDAYVLKASPKDHTLEDEWHELIAKRIRRYDIDRILGGKDCFYQAGFSWGNDTFFLITVDDPEKFNFPQDVVEINNLEYLSYLNTDHEHNSNSNPLS